MPEYLASATDANGRRVTDFITAPSADAAQAIHERHGYRDVLLHWDDVTALLNTGSIAKGRLSPFQILTLTRQSELSFLSDVFAKTAVVIFWLIVLLYVISLPVPFRLPPWPRTWKILWPIAALPIAMIIGFAWYRHRRAMFRDYAWGRWEELLRRLEKTGGSAREKQIVQLRTIALAALGNVENALLEAEQLQADETVPRWFYWLVVAQIYQAARDHSKQIEALKLARAEAPDNATLILVLATTLVQFKRDTNQAKELIAEAKKHTIADMLQHQLALITGMIALEEGDAKSAMEDLEKARREARPVLRNELFIRVDGLTSAYLCLANSQLGDYNAARKYYRRAEPIFRALQSHDLISRCRHAAGL